MSFKYPQPTSMKIAAAGNYFLTFNGQHGELL